MKILITGANSYIGTSFEKYVGAHRDCHEITTLDMRDDNWRKTDFSGFDCVFHVAGIAHDTSGRRNKDKDLYYKINCELAIETAEKARSAGVGQFIFMSSILIYNGCKDKTITSETTPRAKGFYADSKLQADTLLQKMAADAFKVVILRPPMIYGPGCKGNYPRLVSLAMKVPFFPNIRNERSMLHIDRLCENILDLAEKKESGIFFPQDPEYVCTSLLVRDIAAKNGKKLRLTRLFNWAVWLSYPFLPPIRKLFGSLKYDIKHKISVTDL